MAVWTKDAGITEMIEYFDQTGVAPDYDGTSGGWLRLANKPSELKVVMEQIQKCRQDFSYFARNFLWITTKEREKIPFRLKESQELILERLMAMKAAGKAQRLMILKSRQLGCSTLIEGLITWRTVLFGNVNAIIVSKNPDHAAYLFGMLQFGYDNLPWFLKPMQLSRKIEEGLIFDNPDHKSRAFAPGLNSKVSVQAANQGSGVGQGRTVTSAHISEIGDFSDEEAKSIIEGDLGHALANNSETFAVIESTAKGTGNYFHRLWRKNVELGDLAKWEPLFLGWFFEKNQRLPVPNPYWKPDHNEVELRDRILQDWTRCDNRDCRMFRETIWKGLSIAGTICKSCKVGTMQPYRLTDQQLCWMQVERLNAQKDADSLKELLAEQASTPEDAFQLSGTQVFPQECRTFVKNQLQPPIAQGFLDKQGMFHGVIVRDDNPDLIGRCPLEGCSADHNYDDKPLSIWKYPEPNTQYCAGVDVADGLGEDYDYSVLAMNRIGNMREPDEIVAIFRSNEIKPIDFAYPVAGIGRWYNDAMMSIEVNKFDTTFSFVRNQLQYPNLYRWKHVDSTHMNSHKWGWETNMKSKPRLWQTAIHWLRHRMWIIHSDVFLQEMETFQKESAEDRGAKAECFAAGTQVTTWGFVPKPIEDIRAGDVVLTSSGEWQKVSATATRQYSGDLISIKVSGVPRRIVCSPNHPFLVKMRYGGQLLPDAMRDNGRRWLRAEFLRKADLLHVPKATLLSGQELSLDQLYAYGFWIAEGHLLKRRGRYTGVGFTNSEREPLDKVLEALRRWFPTRTILVGNQFVERHPKEVPFKSRLARRQRGGKPIHELIMESAEMAEWFAAQCGEYSHGKRIPLDVAMRHGIEPLLAGWIDGDGCLRNGQQSDLTVHTNAPVMAWQSLNALRSSGRWATMQRRLNHDERHRDGYLINVKAQFLEGIETLKKRTKHRYSAHKVSAPQADGGFYVSIDDVQIIPNQECTLYNLTVDGDRTYTAEGVSVHNSGFYDDVMLAGLIALYCSHDSDWDENLGSIPVRRQGGEPGTYPWVVKCNKCGEERGVHTPEQIRHCLNCGSLFIQANRNVAMFPAINDEFEQLEGYALDRPPTEPVYDEM